MKKLAGAITFVGLATASIVAWGALGNQVFMGGPGGSGWQTWTGDVTVNSAGVSLISAGAVTNTKLANTSTTVNGQTCTLGSPCTVTATASSLTVGTTSISGGSNGHVLYDNSAVLGELATLGSGSVFLTSDANVAFLDVNQSFTKGQAVTPFTISSCTGTVTPDASQANDFLCTLSGSITLANPTNLKAGQTLNFWFTQPSSAGPDTLSLGSAYQAAGGTSGFVLSTANSAKDFMSCRADTTGSLTCVLELAVAH